ncbi:hypothetical protein AGIG_G20161 [Arapaima gigas]
MSSPTVWAQSFSPSVSQMAESPAAGPTAALSRGRGEGRDRDGSPLSPKRSPKVEMMSSLLCVSKLFI